MEHRLETLSFGERFGEPFRLEIRRDTHGELHFTLFHGLTAVTSLHKPTLALLRYMAERSNEELLESEILDEFWPKSVPNIIDTHISLLRKALGEAKPPDPPRFIETLHGHGYRFLPEVKREGDLGGVDAFPEWSNRRFFALLGNVERGGGPQTEDLRILTTGFSTGVWDLKLERLLRKQVRIKILMMNPRNDALIAARYSLRGDKKGGRGLRELEEQIGEIEDLARRYPPNNPVASCGSLELQLSDVMPCGFVVHTKNWALLGIFPAHTSYVDGPMLEIHSDTEAWRVLLADWKARWKDAESKAALRKETGTDYPGVGLVCDATEERCFFRNSFWSLRPRSQPGVSGFHPSEKILASGLTIFTVVVRPLRVTVILSIPPRISARGQYSLFNPPLASRNSMLIASVMTLNSSFLLICFPISHS